MKQIVVLERSDLDKLKGGEMLTLAIPGGKAIDVILEKTNVQESKDGRMLTLEGKTIREGITEVLKVNRETGLTANALLEKLNLSTKSGYSSALQALMRKGEVRKEDNGKNNFGRTRYKYIWIGE